MYKVFYNQKPINFTTVLGKNTKNTPLFFIKYANANSITKALKDKTVTEVYLYHSNPDKFEKHFFRIFPSVQAAGGLVQHQDGRFLFIYRNKKWDLPKGKIEKNETLMKAAKREVSEETGVTDLEVKKPLPITYHIYNANGNLIEETFVKWDDSSNQCLAGYTLKGNFENAETTIEVSGQAQSFLNTGVDTRVYFIRNF